jgi:hypothetical protein
MFLREGGDGLDIHDRLTIKPDTDGIGYVPGALLRQVEREKVTRSGMMKIAGTELYTHMTVRTHLWWPDEPSCPPWPIPLVEVG